MSETTQFLCMDCDPQLVYGERDLWTRATLMRVRHHADCSLWHGAVEEFRW